MILNFQDVHAAGTPAYDSSLAGVNFTLKAGDLLLLSVSAKAHRIALADLAGGLVAPDSGAVTFLEEDWRGMTPDHAAARRGNIGRVFEVGGWLSNLDVIENIILAQRCHTNRSDADLLEAARNLAREFGLEELPAGRSHAVARQDLRRAQWVRAFLGQPRLLVFEHPTLDLESHWTDRLIAGTQAARKAGAAALWITSDPDEWNNCAINPTLKFELKDARLRAVT